MNIIQRIFNWLPDFKGKLRLAKIFLLKKKQAHTFLTKNGVKYSVPNLIENVSYELYINGHYEKDTISHICRTLPNNGIFIDVGANIGAISVEVAILRPDITVISFEASPSVFQYLKKNKEQNDLSNLYIYNLAIHENGGINLPFYSPKEQNGKGSFAPVFTSLSENVKTVRLDDFISESNLTPDLIKIDVEGFEYVVLKSLNKFFDLGPKFQILFEFGDWSEQAAGIEIGAAQQYLLNNNFSLVDFYSKNPIQVPILEGCSMILAYHE